MRKVYTSITIKVVMNIEDGVRVGDVVDELDYNFHIPEEMGYIDDTEVVDFEVHDSK